jgi:hypothetical protein
MNSDETGFDINYMGLNAGCPLQEKEKGYLFYFQTIGKTKGNMLILGSGGFYIV